MIRILYYINGTPGQGVLYENRGYTQIVGYCDATGHVHLKIDAPLLGIVCLLEEI